MKQITADVKAQVAANLVANYGASGLTTQMAQDVVDKLVAGEPDKGILSMMARSMLVKGGYLPEEAQK